MNQLNAIWISAESVILLVNVTSGYSISLSPNDSEKMPYLPSMAWLRIKDENSLLIKVCNKARSSAWQNINFRFLNQDLQWYNGKRDFLFKQVVREELPHDAYDSLNKWEAYFKDTYASGYEIEL